MPAKKIIKKVVKKKVVKKVIKKRKKTEKKEEATKEKRIPGKPYKYAEYLIFIVWIATPRIEREPERQGEFAKKYGLNTDTIAEWKKKVEFWDEVRAVRNRDLLERTGDVLRKLEVVALEGEVPAMKLFLQYTSQLIEKSENKLGASPELIEALDRMRKVLPD